MILRLRALLAALACLVSGLAAAQADFRPFGKEQIDQLTAQVALFPDALLSQVLMASTYPKDVAEASAWARANPDEKGDAAVALVQDKPWDPSVQSLVAFPQVVVMMGENPTWVKDLGDAFLLQPEDVMDSVQRLRLAAQNAGNLQSNEQVVVKVETQPPPDIVVQVNAPPPPPQVIVIEQRSPEVIFVPMYNPVNVFGPWMWPAFPPVWIPPPPGFWWSWRSPVAVGIWWGVGIGVTHTPPGAAPTGGAAASTSTCITTTASTSTTGSIAATATRPGRTTRTAGATFRSAAATRRASAWTTARRASTASSCAAARPIGRAPSRRCATAA
ncbi:MAG: DUF3300 domain-containing protein [Betaproteobacteria bacterium]|nr:DUF3300 domain-containing protein [Betaproteobacteria bacterium]